MGGATPQPTTVAIPLPRFPPIPKIHPIPPWASATKFVILFCNTFAAMH